MSKDDEIELEHRAKLETLGTAIHEFFNSEGKEPMMCFLLLVAPFGDGEGRTNYISNGDRQDAITLMKEMIARFEGQPELKGNA